MKSSLEEKHQSVGDHGNHVEPLKEEIRFLRAENQIKTAIIKTMSEKDKSFAQCSHSIIAPIPESPKGYPKSNSPRKSGCSEVFGNIVEVSKENGRDKLPLIRISKY